MVGSLSASRERGDSRQAETKSGDGPTTLHKSTKSPQFLRLPTMPLAHSTLADDGLVCPCGWLYAPRFSEIPRRLPYSPARTPPGTAGAIPVRVARRPDPGPLHLWERRRDRQSAHKASPTLSCQLHPCPNYLSL